MWLQHLDTVIAFVGIMLLLSLTITTAVQAVVSILGLRGRNLAWGIEQLLRRIGKDPLKKDLRALTGRVLDHDVLSAGSSWLRRAFGIGRWGPQTMRREEIVLVLDELREAGGEAKDTLTRVLPEATAPGTSATSYLERAAHWYDTVMDATADRFKLWSRWWTAGFAVVLAFGFQVDSTDLLRQLSTSGARNQVLGQIDGIDDVYGKLYDNAVKEAMADKRDDSDESKVMLRALEDTNVRIKESLAASGLQIFHMDWRKERFQGGWFGMLVTALLLSLGAPFWYGALRKLVGFRSAATKRIEEKDKAAAT